MNNDKRQIELAYHLLFTLPGSPILYYGDEIGMGDNINLPDRNGVNPFFLFSVYLEPSFPMANPYHLFLSLSVCV